MNKFERENTMTVDDMLKVLNDIKQVHGGELPLVYVSHHDYWGKLYHYLGKEDVGYRDNLNPDGPKKINFIEGVCIDTDY